MKHVWILVGVALLGALGIGYLARSQYFTSPAVLAVEEPKEPQFVDTTDPNDLLPDLVPLPPRDLVLEETPEGAILLRFSTTYYNQGRGTLELVADPKTKGINADIERDVIQKIYLVDGSHRNKLVGNFLWHQQHLHYHYTDFVTYDLNAVDAPFHSDLGGDRIKSTFCLRDVSTFEIDLPNRVEEAVYKICGKELQGVSVGWGDTYYFDYPGQLSDISNLSSGTYRLTFDVNPEKRLEEIRYDNNVSSALFKLNMEKKTVTVLEETPRENPVVNHVHLEDPFTQS